MQLILNRHIQDSNCTIGEMVSAEGDTIAPLIHVYTLEPPAPSDSFKGRIPSGRYQLICDYSPKFNRDMPLLLNVPGFEGVRIHWGNTAIDTEACILVGNKPKNDEVENSIVAFNALYDKIKAVLNSGENIWITIIDPMIIK